MRTRRILRSVESSTSNFKPSSVTTSPGRGMRPAISVTKPATVVASRSSGRNPNRLSRRSTSMLPGTTQEPLGSFTGSAFDSCSSGISPTISSTMSSIVTMPATAPYSSMTISRRTLSRCISRSRSLTRLLSGTKRTSFFIRLRTVRERASVSATCSTSCACTMPTMWSMDPSYTGIRE